MADSDLNASCGKNGIVLSSPRHRRGRGPEGVTNQFRGRVLLYDDRPRGVVGDHRGLGHRQLHVFGDLVSASGHNDLALVCTLIWPLDILDLESVC